MAFKNQNVKGAKARGVAASGNPNPKANMPANNIGMHKVVLGSGKASTFGKDVNPATAQKGAKQSTTGGYANTPAHNNNLVSPPLGTTHHALGEVPKYLRGGKAAH